VRPVPADEPADAKNLFYSGGAAGSPAASAQNGQRQVSTGLRYRILKQTPTGGEREVDSDTVFQSGDRVRFAFESNVDGHLYVILEGSSGRWTVLFPHPQINGGRNAVRRLEQYQVPSNSWFLFDENPGTERVFVFLSTDPVDKLPGFEQPLMIRPEMVVAQATIDLLSRSVSSRDLVLQHERTGAQATAGAALHPATYIVNKGELGKAVATTIQLVHK
jgi:hypothetical protein